MARRQRATPISPGCSTSCTTSRRSGTAGFVLANGSMSSNQSGEGEIRKNLIEADLVDCIVALPGQLFRSTQIPACLWFLSRGRSNGEPSEPAGRDTVRRRPQAGAHDGPHPPGFVAGRTSPASRTPTTPGEGRRAWTSTPTFPASVRARRWRRSAEHGHVLTPGRYVGAEPQPDDGEPFEEKMARLAAQWREQQAEAQRLDAAIEANLARLGFGEGP